LRWKNGAIWCNLADAACAVVNGTGRTNPIKTLEIPATLTYAKHTSYTQWWPSSVGFAPSSMTRNETNEITIDPHRRRAPT
jgi:hypothetical protein